ncbi:hypothetical protein ACLUX0_03115 [Limosilactobacillus mucosae]
MILVDDGSLDNSPKICDDWASKKRVEIKILANKVSGIG